MNTDVSVRDRIDELGIARVCYAAVMRRLETLGLFLFQVQIGDDRLDIPMPDLPAGYTVEQVTPEELMAWVDKDKGLHEQGVREAIRNGDRCVANFYHGELVGYGFVTNVRARVTDQIEVVVDDRLVYRYRGWTDPKHRRKRLSYARARLNRRVFPLRDGRRTVSYVATHNFPSLLNPSHIRPIVLGYCGYVRLFGREYPFTQRRPRRFGFRLVRRGDGQAEAHRPR